MARVIPCEIRIMDMPEFKAFCEAVEKRIAELERERDEWEERYDWLLGQCGGTAPQ